uniref:Protein kinase domain-containing protein n=1 Tax=Aegilops tauschii subsp. strangulata TaxID=200361 RepID=A0A453H9U8_AEGTS
GCEAKKSVARAGGKFVRLDFVSFSSGAPKSSSDPGPYMAKQPPSNLQVCEQKCRDDPSCPAFGYKFGGDRTCLLYKTRLVDGYWSPGTEMSTFVRVAEAENDTNPFTGMTSMIDTVCPVQLALPVPPKQKAKTIRNIAIITALFAVELLAGVLSFWAFLRKYSQYREMARTLGLEYLPAGGPRRFSYAELKTATKDFTDVVGRGAYGTVFRGELPDRRAVAVKQLHGVGGGEAEFWAEVTIIARMHHLNLVRMWGFCADKDQRMLVYEYVPNGSLDKYLFSSSSSAAPSGGDAQGESCPGGATTASGRSRWAARTGTSPSGRTRRCTWSGASRTSWTPASSSPSTTTPTASPPSSAWSRRPCGASRTAPTCAPPWARSPRCSRALSRSPTPSSQPSSASRTTN